MKKKKIVFFDTWVSALRQIDYYAKLMYEQYNIIFLSIDKFHNKYLSKELRDNNQNSYLSRKYNNKYYSKITDIANYNNSMALFFEKEKPDLAISISLHNLDHRWFNISCQNYNVPIYFIMHGIKGDTVFAKANGKKISFLKFKRLLFYNILYYFYYNDTKKYSNLNRNNYKEWKEMIFNHDKFKFNPRYSYNVKYQKAFVTTDSDIEFYLKSYNTLQSCKFLVAGTMDLIELSEEFEKYRNISQDQVTFIGQPMDDFITTDNYLKTITDIFDYFRKKGVKMVFRPHPREHKDTIVFLNNHGVYISDKKIVNDLVRSFCIIGYNSTLLLTSLYMQCPVISFKLKGVPHPKFLINNDQSFVYSDINDFKLFFEWSLVNFKRDNSKVRIINPVKLLKEEIEKEFYG